MSLVSILSSPWVIFKTELKSQISLGLLIANPFIFILRESVWILCRKHWVWIFFIHNVSGSCPETYFILQILWHFTSGIIIQIGFRLLNAILFIFTSHVKCSNVRHKYGLGLNISLWLFLEHPMTPWVVYSYFVHNNILILH